MMDTNPGGIAPMPNPPASDRHVRFRLYLAGSTPSSRRAVINLEAAFLEFHGRVTCGMEYIDVLLDAKRAVADSVVMTPTLVASCQNSRLVIIGDLSDSRKLLDFLRTLAR
jgi:hypothetical protein